jgi:small-conductance mechanosensitive channel
VRSPFPILLALLVLSASLHAAEPPRNPARPPLVDLAIKGLGHHIYEVWTTPLFTLTDSAMVNGQVVQRPSSVTLGMMLTALAILLVGGIFAAGFSRWLRSHLAKRFNLEPTTAAIVQKFTNYTLLFLASLLALSAVRIPLTIFALLGGAAAIAVGFGAQQLVNNLISGLILLFERPIRIGDRIEVGSFSGTVSSIGTRCCQLHRDDGVEILIPNSVILQGTVVNHTLRDNSSLVTLPVSIAPDASAESAIQVLHEIADSHPDILKNRPSSARVTEIGASSISLELACWIKSKNPDEIDRVQSDLRIAILQRVQSGDIKLA